MFPRNGRLGIKPFITALDTARPLNKFEECFVTIEMGAAWQSSPPSVVHKE
jgi:hypothetical protein